MGQEVLKKFDRYFLLDSIAQGGMAEIYRARPASPDAAGRLLVIKRILSGYGKNKDFLKMFKSEINVMLGFNHPNIVQLYDFGQSAGQPFIAMEFVDGKNLRQFITRYARKSQTVPVELACYMVEQTAAGLHYAHTFKDKISGRALNIVHRDISPQNILVSYDGAIKIIDFGIAKASTNVESTRVGIIKGKPSYLSPEQISGEKLDGRSDIFSLGTVLWETLTGKKLFAAKSGENEFAVLKLIESSDTYVKPPSKMNPDIPRELDDIVMRALAKKRERRYQTSEELHLALNKFLRSYLPDFTPSDLSHAAKALFKNDIVEDRKTLQKLSAIAEEAIRKDYAEETLSKTEPARRHVKPATKPSGKPPKKAQTFPTFIDPNRIQSTDIGNVFKKGAGDEVSNLEIETGQYRPDLLSGATPKGFKKPFGQRQPQKIKKAPKRNIRAGRRLRLGGDILQNSRSFARSRKNPLVSAVALASVATALYLYVIDPTKPTDECPENFIIDPITSLCIRPERKPASQKTIPLKIKVNPGFWDAEILLKSGLEGRLKRIPQSELNGYKVPIDQPLILEIRQPEYRVYRREWLIRPYEVTNNMKYWELNIVLEPESFGYVSVTSTPYATATLTRINCSRCPATEFVQKTPFEELKVPTGTYKVNLQNRVLGMGSSINVEIKEGKSVRRNVQLRIQN